jgi:hypothetical protein
VASPVFALALFFVPYLLMGSAVFYYLTRRLKGSCEDTLLKKLIGLPFLPAFVAWGIVFALLSIPLYWLYPEKHMMQIDLEGSDEEKQRLKEYRAVLWKKGLARRLGEKFGLIAKSDTPWPFR